MTTTKTLLILSGTLWLIAVLFVAYALFVQLRQRTILRSIAHRLLRIDRALTQLFPPDSPQPTPAPEDKTHPETSIAIDKNEPLSKYETVTLPDEININFVDR